MGRLGVPGHAERVRVGVVVEHARVGVDREGRVDQDAVGVVHGVGGRVGLRDGERAVRAAGEGVVRGGEVARGDAGDRVGAGGGALGGVGGDHRRARDARGDLVLAVDVARDGVGHGERDGLAHAAAVVARVHGERRLRHGHRERVRVVGGEVRVARVGGHDRGHGGGDDRRGQGRQAEELLAGGGAVAERPRGPPGPGTP